MNQTRLALLSSLKTLFGLVYLNTGKISCCIGNASYLAVSPVSSWYMHG